MGIIRGFCKAQVGCLKCTRISECNVKESSESEVARQIYRILMLEPLAPTIW